MENEFEIHIFKICFAYRLEINLNGSIFFLQVILNQWYVVLDINVRLNACITLNS